MKALLFWAAILGAVFCEETFVGDQVLRIRASNDEQIQQLLSLESLTSLQLDFWKAPKSVESPVDIRVPFQHVQNVKAFLEHHGIDYEIMIDDLQTLLDEEKEEMTFTQTLESRSGTFNFGTYHTLDNIYKAIEGLTAAYSGLITTQQIGTSYEGRPLIVVKFSTGGSNRPAIWLDAGIHSREWVTQATALWTVNQLAAQYKRDASVTALLDQMDVYILIVTNPDGYVYTHQSNRMWRKTRSKKSGSLCVGADPNRNWDAGFGGPGTSADPCSDTYHGPSAESEVEVKSVANFIRSHGNFKAFLTIHSYSQLLMYPFGYKCTNPADKSELDAVARSAANAITSLYGTRYKVGTICSTIYQASGGSIDWSYDYGIKYSFAFELRDTGRYGFVLPASQIIPTAEETWLGLKKIFEHVRDNPY